MTRGRALAMLAVSLVALLGGTVAVSATAAPDRGSATEQHRQPPPRPLPTVDSSCEPGSAQPQCLWPSGSPTATPPVSTGLPLPPTEVTPLPPCDPTLPLQPCQPTDAPTSTPTSTTPCTGEGCIPQPGATTTPPPTSGGQPGKDEESEDECGITDIGACITEAINAFFRGIVTAALNPLLDLLANTLLTTPLPSDLPRIGELWSNSWQILLACYALLVLIAGILVMSYETLQTRHSVKEIAPRLVVGVLAGALSLWAATKAIQIANALAHAVMGGGVDASGDMVAPGDALKDMILGSLTGGIWIIFMGIFLAGMLVVLLVTYVVRIALTLVLIAGAPLALMFHALPQTEGIARWWWKAFGGCLAIQVVQSLVLITAMRVFFAPGGFTMFGPNVSGLVNLLVAMALMYILFKIPFWLLGSLRVGNGRSIVGSLARGFIAYKTFGLFTGGRHNNSGGAGGSGGGRRGPRPSSGGTGRGGHRGGHGSGRGAADPYARTRSTADGQYMLPLPGVRRTRPVALTKPTPEPAPVPKARAARRRQTALPLGDDWPENKPVLGRDGQYQLPLDVARSTTARSRIASAPPDPGQPDRRRGGGGRQLELPLDPYQGNRPTRSGQYPLPLDGLQRRQRTPRPPNPPAAARQRSPGQRIRATQPELPFDPYQGNRPTRSGQHPLPLDGVRRVPPAKPDPAPPPAPRAGRQLRLPLDLPEPPRTSGGKP